jgi:hypothetical protein
MLRAHAMEHNYVLHVSYWVDGTLVHTEILNYVLHAHAMDYIYVLHVSYLVDVSNNDFPKKMIFQHV